MIINSANFFLKIQYFHSISSAKCKKFLFSSLMIYSIPREELFDLTGNEDENVCVQVI